MEDVRSRAIERQGLVYVNNNAPPEHFLLTCGSRVRKEEEMRRETEKKGGMNEYRLYHR